MFIDKREDPSLFDELDQAVRRIVRQSEPYEFEIRKRASSSTRDVKLVKGAKNSKDMNGLGYCIRCGTKIPIAMEKPMCDSCLDDWSQSGDEKNPERYCMMCGREDTGGKISFSKPVCYPCYRKHFKNR